MFVLWGKRATVVYVKCDSWMPSGWLMWTNISDYASPANAGQPAKDAEVWASLRNMPSGAKLAYYPDRKP